MALDPVTAKGKCEPLPVWRAGAPRSRLGVDVIRDLTTPGGSRRRSAPAARHLRRAVSDPVQLITIVGEPGVGKSRLVAELLAYVDALPDLVTWRQGRCLPYGDGITYWALGEIVKAHAGIDDARGRGHAEVSSRSPNARTPMLMARLLPFIGVESGAAAAREESFRAWRAYMESFSDVGPTVLVIEDVHWADEALLAFVEHLVQWAQDVPLLLVCTTRPELLESRRPGARERPRDDDQAVAAVGRGTAQRLGPARSGRPPATTQRSILDRAGGNPLYAEEFVGCCATATCSTAGASSATA